MNNINKKVTSTFLIFSFLFSSLFSSLSRAESDIDICKEQGTVIVFFNGVNTTIGEANRSLNELWRIHGDTSVNGDKIRYEKLYNYSNGFEDFVETFEQRLKEQEGLLEGRFELFLEAISGGGSWWSNIVDTVSSSASLLKSFVDLYQASVVQSLTTLVANPPTTVNYIEHRNRIDNWILKGEKMLFIAHSQGNLFANAAYNYATSKVSENSVKVVHVAPASPLLNGNYTLADKDLVINGLRIAGSVPDNTNIIPGYLLRSAGVNGEKDILGHGFLEIYLNKSLSTSSRVKEHVNSALELLVAPPKEATEGFFTALLFWNGAGDVDLHTFEPNGFQVYYGAKQGTSGFLDVDNTVADGPEHYYATCDSSTIQTGVYKIAIANYSRANGKIATVQIASSLDGVLGTKEVVLGAVTGDTPGYYLFDVGVDKDSETGRYSVSLK